MTGGIAVSAVVPVKDEAGNVGPLAREIAAALAGEAHEIIFVDDGSADATAQELAALKTEIPALRVLRHGRNLGQSRTLVGERRLANIPLYLFPQLLRAIARMVWGHVTQPRDEAFNREIVVFHFLGLMQGLYRSR